MENMILKEFPNFNKTIKEFLIESEIYKVGFQNANKFCLIYTSIYGMCGIALRNYIRTLYPIIDKLFLSKYGDNWYGKYEDWLHEIAWREYKKIKEDAKR